MENLTESHSSVIGLATKKFHERCMPFVWKSQSAAEKLEKRKAGLVKRYGSVSVLNQIVPSLSIKSAPIQNTITIKTFGGTVVKLQSAHPRGVRFLIWLLCWLFCYFNPRTRGGCDGKYNQLCSKSIIFGHLLVGYIATF